MDIEELNACILEQYDRHIDAKFKDYVLMPLFMKSESVVTACKVVECAIDEIVDNKRDKRMFMRKIIPMVIPAGVKGNIRGAIFNKCIASILQRFTKGMSRVSIAFEVPVPGLSEIADFVIKTNKKTIVGYNQLDMWKGGAQINRAAKYILDEALHQRLNKKNIYVVCVVSRKLELKSTNSKIMNIVTVGLKKDRLMWPHGLRAYLKNIL